MTMNNTLCLGLFLLVMHARGLRWEYSSEVIVILGGARMCESACVHVHVGVCVCGRESESHLGWLMTSRANTRPEPWGMFSDLCPKRGFPLS